MFFHCLFFRQSLAIFCQIRDTSAVEIYGLTRCVVRSLLFMLRPIGFKLVLTGLVLGLLLATGLVEAKRPVAAEPAAPVSLAELPQSGVQTFQLIHRGGPFAHEKDGVVFGNREHRLPAMKRGYYREYTVATPHSRNRGIRRIVCGGQATAPDNCYYTDDHYASFRRIVP